MWMIGYAIAGLLGLGAAICGLMIAIDAFKKSPAKGILALLFFPYLIFYGFSSYEHPKAKMITTFTLVLPLLALFTMNASTALLGPDVSVDVDISDDGFDDDLELDDEDL